MKSVLNKDIIRDIRKSRGRFLSILCIVALGVAFFSGIKVSPIVMKKTSDDYYDKYNFMDIKIISTLGLIDEDVNEVKKIPEVDGIFPTYSTDVLTDYKSEQHVLKIHALPINEIAQNSKNYINKVNVVDGRLPQNSGECVVEQNKVGKFDVPIGTKIKLESGTDDKLDNTLKKTEYTVVGKIETPYYLSYEKGSSSIGNGTISSVIMIPQDDFKIDSYTEMFVTLKGAKEKNSYDDKYFEDIKVVTNKIDDISKGRIDARYNEVINTANDELDKGKLEYYNKKKEVSEKLENAEINILNSEKQLKKGEEELKRNQQTIKKQIEDGKLKINQGENSLNNGYLQYEKGLKLFNDNKSKAEIGFKDAQQKLDDLNSKIDNLYSYNKTIESKLNDDSLSLDEIEYLKSELDKNNKIINDLNISYEQGIKNLNLKKQELINAEQKLTNTKETLDKNKQKLELEKRNLVLIEKKSEKEFKKSEERIKDGKIKLESGKLSLKESKEKAEDELDKANKKIKDSEDEIKKIEKPEWYILDRNSHYSYAEYASCASSIDALSKIFPVFFFSVAALVCLTTMTRMVDEQRVNIGTLKALGYTKGKIAKKYILYALIASLIGSIIGILIGFTVFPIVVFNAYKMMYVLPKVQLSFNFPLAMGVTFTAISITTIAAYSACYKELRENPSVLMRPKAPKNGKRIWLEKIPFIWDKVGFIGKVTIRNIFRYKKRFLMTILGISGCTALILTGLGIKDSIQMIVDVQYGRIFKYDMTITIDNSAKLSEIKKIHNRIDSTESIASYLFMNNQNGKLISDEKEKQITIVIPKDKIKMEEFIGLQDRASQKNIKIIEDGIVLSEKTARDLELKVGDTVEILNSKDQIAKAKIIGITENYVSHYVYMSKEYYKKLYKRDINYNRVVGTISDKSINGENTLSKDLVGYSKINGISFNTGVKENFENTVKSLNYVVLIMTISAGALAFVVLYNLTNVNISERIREIATIKVLGFYDNEVSAYIYRENIILTIIGTFVGLGIGKLLHQFIMITVEIESMMFGRVIGSKSYIIAAILTIVLGLIVNFTMYYKLKNVKMVESLKSVD
ncbi:ABC transporter permease [Romboutsia lituseburensis]|uniref:ABC transporter permease n=1 Tax=Romboutsia lituseburensis TaxID=1537 RepID=UPI00215B728D|nr:ABC transporter permease [Romboutsia lituseburensis]MCR8746374.1 FtsX-like permease family protein [Romboutsia lituseburensis]